MSDDDPSARWGEFASLPGMPNDPDEVDVQPLSGGEADGPIGLARRSTDVERLREFVCEMYGLCAVGHPHATKVEVEDFEFTFVVFVLDVSEADPPEGYTVRKGDLGVRVVDGTVVDAHASLDGKRDGETVSIGVMLDDGDVVEDEFSP
jgi:hypothetical protein